MKLFIVDGIGPFFRARTDRRRINWSKIPFAEIERDGVLDPECLIGIRADFTRFVTTVAQAGFNAITLDDVAHLALHPEYPAEIVRKVESYRKAYADLFQIAAAAGLQVFVTTDIMFTHSSIDERLRSLERGVIPFLRDAIAQVFDLFPPVSGIIARLGECDGIDVHDDFRSRLAIRTPQQARRVIEGLLPVCASRGKLLVMRTWTVGAYRIGDLIWNRDTFDRVFDKLEDPHLVVSLKYGESDFFRFLPLNELFFRSKHQKIVELQARREYEGFGEYPSFIGWQYENYIRQLRALPNVVGGWIWCQTGGWSRFQRITFLRDSSIWNEINTLVTLALLRTDCTTEDAVHEFCVKRLGSERSDVLLALLRLSDEVIRELLYIDDFAQRKLFFRRLRVPPLLSVYWDRILINHPMRKLLRCFVQDGEQKIRQGYAALRKIEAMQPMAETLGLPVADLRFQYDTFEILAAARAYYFGPYSVSVARQLEEMKQRYKARYTTRYAVKLNFNHFGLPRTRLRLLLRFFLRPQRSYRLLDRLVLIRLLAWIAPLLRLRKGRLMPKFANKQAMGLQAVLR